ncbi:FliA/WhiG family RNA polymerase sigma factor [Litchfieldia salsa]|uniref:RNA polymerase, sigma 28 subunit, SigD/FliA/WhiG n=1 Tax=Litchfieldia salsa TaxID=930152 RepID=A0A1H0R729_9BACI|nr:FliA/WhiG family RNA polymerase sigma factor [Litchfieldia salsa]SDP24778.1 RNA polymerase, sigma 28 subunit, SigD/FliA/WhiG [Litchfieldia salsa]
MSQMVASDDQVYWQQWIDSRDSHAGDVLIRRYMPLVAYHVQRIAAGLPKSVRSDDLKSFGMMGLYDALEKFDPSRDLKFDTYASFRVRGAILDGLRKEDWLPRSLRDKAKKIELASQQLEQKLMRNITTKEIANELGLSEEDVLNTINEGFFANVLSMDEQHSDGEGKEGLEFTIKDTATLTPEDDLLKKEQFSQLVNVIKQLNENEQMVVSLFYQEELTLTEIGQVMNLSTSRISQIHSKALFKLKQFLENAY